MTQKLLFKDIKPKIKAPAWHVEMVDLEDDVLFANLVERYMIHPRCEKSGAGRATLWAAREVVLSRIAHGQPPRDPPALFAYYVEDAEGWGKMPPKCWERGQDRYRRWNRCQTS